MEYSVILTYRACKEFSHKRGSCYPDREMGNGLNVGNWIPMEYSDMFIANPNKIKKTPARLATILTMLTTLMMTAFIAPVVMANETTPVDVELGWDTVPEPNVVGYRVYIGTASGQYPRVEEATTDPSHMVTGLERGVTYYFVVAAFNDQGAEGVPSEELVVTTETPPLPMRAGIVAPTTGDSGQVLRWSFPQTALSSSPEMIIQQSSDLVTWTEADAVGSSDYESVDGENVTFEWPIPAAGGGSMFYRLTARNWLGDSTQP